MSKEPLSSEIALTSVRADDHGGQAEIVPNFESILNLSITNRGRIRTIESGEVVFHCTNGQCESCFDCAACEL